MYNDSYLIEILANAKKRGETPEERLTLAGGNVMAYLAGHCLSAARRGDNVAARIKVQIHSMMPHLINAGGE